MRCFIELGEHQIIVFLSELVKPCAFGDGDLVAMTFTGLEHPVVNVDEGILAENCTPSHLSPDFGVASEHSMDESFRAFFNVVMIPTGKGWDSPLLPKVGVLKKVCTCGLPILV